MPRVSGERDAADAALPTRSIRVHPQLTLMLLLRRCDLVLASVGLATTAEELISVLRTPL